MWSSSTSRLAISSRGTDVRPGSVGRPGPKDLGSHLARARLARGLSQAELANRCGLSQAQISYFEVGQRHPTLDHLVRIAGALDCSMGGLITGSDRPGNELRHMAIELRSLGVADLWIKDAVIPGAFRRPEELIAAVIGGEGPEPRIVEAIPAVLAWNELNPILLRAYGMTTRPRVTRRLAWLADIALAIDRRGGFPGGCRRQSLERFIRIVRRAVVGSREWDSLGRPAEEPPTSPIWKRWRINYDADLARFEQRARHLAELRGQSTEHGAAGVETRNPSASRGSDGRPRQVKRGASK